MIRLRAEWLCLLLLLFGWGTSFSGFLHSTGQFIVVVYGCAQQLQELSRDRDAVDVLW